MARIQSKVGRRTRPEKDGRKPHVRSGLHLGLTGLLSRPHVAAQLAQSETEEKKKLEQSETEEKDPPGPCLFCFHEITVANLTTNLEY